MSHVAANNEIIRMRPTVRKSRVGLVWKLTKESRLLKKRKHGDEKVLKKCKRKCEKLIREIKAIKKLKDDDIARFAILNTRSLQEVLADPKVDRKTRVMTKLAFHKHLKSSVDKFREKFPNYKLGKRQLGKLELKKSLGIEKLSASADKSDKSADNHKGESESDGESGNVDSEDEDDLKTEENSEEFLKGEEDEESLGKSQKNKTKIEVDDSKKLEISKNKIKESLKSKKNKRNKNLEEFSDCKKKNEVIKSSKTNENSPTHELNSIDDIEGAFAPEKTEVLHKKSEESNNLNIKLRSTGKISEEKIKVVSNVAAVKRLKIGESLEENEETIPSSETINLPSSSEKMDLDREVDSFFISSSDGGIYRSVIVPKQNSSVDDEDRDGSSVKKKFKARNSFDQRRREENFKSKVDFKKNRKDFCCNELISDKSKNRRDKFSNQSGDKIGENLHPSWAARKKQQEVLKQGFQGKKIVFSDD